MKRSLCASTTLAFASIALAGMSGGATAQSGETFYKGKTISLYVGSEPGGAYDAYGRAVARHLPDHIPGRPNVVVKNMPGASGIRLAGYMYNVAQKDGTDIAGVHNTIVVEELLGAKVQFKSQDFAWLGSANQLTSTCVSHANSGIKTLQEAKQKELLVGSTGSASSSTQLVAAYMNNLTGTKFKIIRGYPSTSSVFLAMERGEVGGLCGIGSDSLSTQVATEIKDGKIIILVQTGMKKAPDMPNVPLVLDHARSPEDRLVLEFLVARQYAGRPYVAPPGTPADRVAALRKAFMDVMKDPAFQETSTKMQLPLSPIDGQEVEDHIKKLFATPKSVIDRANAATEVADIREAKLEWKTVNGVRIDTVGERSVGFTDGGKKVSADLADTEVTIGGEKRKAADVKVGMTCDIVYLGDRDATKTLACKP